MKKFLSILLVFLMACNSVIAGALGSSYSSDEYPDCDNVQPLIKSNINKIVEVEGETQDFIEISLDDCIKFALGNNPKIQAAIQDVFASDYRVKQAWSSWFPQISWQTGYTRIRQLQLSDVFQRNLIYNYFTLGQISVSQMLYDFGVTQNQVTIRKMENEQFKIMLTGIVNQVICDVKNAYHYLLFSFEQKRVAEEMVVRYEMFYNQAKAYYTAGISPKVDLTIAEVNLSNAKLGLIEAENQVKIAMATLNNAMGTPYFNQYLIKDKLYYNPCSISLKEAIDVAKESRPDYKLSVSKVETARQNLQLTKKSWFPQLSVEGQYQIGGRTFTSNYGYNLGGYLNFPTINGMLIRNEIKEAKSLYAREQANAISTQNDIYLEIQTAYYSLFEKKSKIPVATLTVKQAKENYELSFGRYRSGVGNPVELKEAQVQYKDAQLNYYNTLYQYNIARANLEKAIGKNIVENQIDIKLDEKQLKEQKGVYKKEFEKKIYPTKEENVQPLKKQKAVKKSFFKTLKDVSS